MDSVIFVCLSVYIQNTTTKVTNVQCWCFVKGHVHICSLVPRLLPCNNGLGSSIVDANGHWNKVHVYYA